MDFFPLNKRGPEHFQYFKSAFEDRGLAEMVKLQKNQANQEVKNDLAEYLKEALNENKTAKEIIAEVKDYSAKNNLEELDVLTIVSSYPNSSLPLHLHLNILELILFDFV